MNQKLLLLTAATIVAVILFFFNFQSKPKKLICSNSKYISSHQQYTKDNSLLKKAQNLFKNGEINVKSNILYTNLEKESSKNFLDLEKVNDIVIEEAKSFFESQTKNKQRVLEIEHKIQKSVRDDPNKKSELCTVNAGSVDIEIKYQGIQIYRGYSEILRFNEPHIRKQIRCIFNSFSSL